MKSFYLLSLGCPKNEVDSEFLSAWLKQAGYHFEPDPLKASYLLVNTCAFIESAKREAIDAILQLADYKRQQAEQGRKAYVIVCGCLSQRYAKEIHDDLPEVDLSLGTAEYQDIVYYLEKLAEGTLMQDHCPGRPGSLEHFKIIHEASKDRPYAYLKVSEGCSHGCAYCAIPLIRGPLRSRREEDLLAEARRHAAAGFKELILVAQDTGRYGEDLYGERRLVSLLRKLCQIEGLAWIRMMYLYADTVSDELLELMRQEPKLLPYFDIPIQHASDAVLKAMRRHDRVADLRALFAKIRRVLPEAMLRTTVLTGFPGETEEDFAELKAFVQEIRFDRLGCFAFSPEEGTRAFRMKAQVPEAVKAERAAEIMAIQKEISLASSKARLGKTYDVLIDGVADDGLSFVGRSYAEAPDVDGRIYIMAQSDDLAMGQIRPCRIVDADYFDLTAVNIL